MSTNNNEAKNPILKNGSKVEIVAGKLIQLSFHLFKYAFQTSASVRAMLDTPVAILTMTLRNGIVLGLKTALEFQVLLVLVWTLMLIRVECTVTNPVHPIDGGLSVSGRANSSDTTNTVVYKKIKYKGFDGGKEAAYVL